MCAKKRINGIKTDKTGEKKWSEVKIRTERAERTKRVQTVESCLKYIAQHKFRKFKQERVWTAILRKHAIDEKYSWNIQKSKINEKENSVAHFKINIKHLLLTQSSMNCQEKSPKMNDKI